MLGQTTILRLGTLLMLLGIAGCGGSGAEAAGLAPPKALQALAGDREVTLTWQASDAAASYNVYQGGFPDLELPVPVQSGIRGTSARITGLSNGSRNYFKVAAVKGLLTSGYSNEASATPQAAPSAGRLSLSAARYDVGQSAGSLSLSITRSGGSQGAVSIRYTTLDGSAVAGRDYTAAGGELNWAGGDSSVRTLVLNISNSSPFSGERRFSLRLSNPGNGAVLDSPAEATVVISGRSGGTGPMGSAAASRLLSQATFGPTTASIEAASRQSYTEWFAAQASAATSLTYPSIRGSAENRNWIPSWWRNAVQGPDQLRQRMAFALSELLVISQQAGPLNSNNKALAIYYDLLAQNALGSYRQLLEKVTLSLQMGVFLNMYHSDKPNPATGVHADQNFAREIMQLFTVGLVELNPDGTPRLDSRGRQIPTYGYSEIENLANAFTGWASNPTRFSGEEAYRFDYDFERPMVGYPDHHDTRAKTIIGGVRIPAGGTPASDMAIALDALVNHANTAPFISKQLIQRLVTSNPSPDYVRRVATVFNDNGAGGRGDLLAVAQAILTDPEAVRTGDARYGKLREPLLRLTHLWRAFDARSSGGANDEFIITQNSSEITGQAPLNASTVFNFFQPDYVRAGPLADAGMVAPEFQITNEFTLVQTNVQYQRQAYQFVDSQGRRYAGNQGFDESNFLGSESVLLQTAAWEPLADNPAGLIDQMNLVLMQGLMPAAMRSTLIDYVSSIASSETAYRARRVVEAADLILNSPQYAVQR